MAADIYLTALLISGLYSLIFFPFIDAAAPVFNPSTYQVSVGTNLTAGTVLAALVYTDPEGQAVTLTVDTTDGGSYFGITGSNLVLVNRLDVEYGEIAWTVNVLAVDTAPETGTATISIKTFQSTTTTSTTPAPPGYNWFDNQDNVIIFGVTAALTAIGIGFCVLMCWRFNRVGTCLPKRCPEYGQCKASFNRQCHCCPIPCNYYEEKVKATPPLLVKDKERVPLPAGNFYMEPKPESRETTFQEEIQERANIVTPVIMGNVDLRDVGFDGMRSPGFNAPMFTSYGGARDHPPPSNPGPRGRGRANLGPRGQRGGANGVPRRKR